MNQMTVRRDSHQNISFNDLFEERNSSETNLTLTPILRTGYFEDVDRFIDQTPDEEVLETSPFNQSAQESLCRRSEATQVLVGPSSSSHILILAAEDSEEVHKTKGLPDYMTFTIIDVLDILFSMGSFLFDIGTDISVAILHYINQDFWYFGLTLAFILVPSLVMNGMSMRWYVLDSRKEGWPPISKSKWIIRFIFIFLQLGPTLRSLDSLIYGIKFRLSNSKEDKLKYFDLMVYESTDASMLSLFESFMEAAPELVFQIYILAQERTFRTAVTDEWTIIAQMVSVLSSLVSLSLSMASYHKALRLSLRKKANMTFAGIAFQFIWRLLTIASRVLVLGLFASEFRFYISIVCAIHWIVMFFWIVSMKTNFFGNHNRVEELGYNAVLAVVFIFCYFNPKGGSTRRRYFIYYMFMFCENIVLMTLWFIYCAGSKWYRVLAICGYFALFFMGIMFMVIYYICFHPTGNIKCFSSKEENQRGETKSAKVSKL